MYKKGFTFIEFIVAVIIAGFFIASGLTAVRSINTSGKYKNIKIDVESAVKAVVEYSGRAQAIPSSLSTILKNGSDLDTLGNNLYYKPASELSTTSGSICGTNSTTLTVQKCPDVSCSTPDETYDNIAFFISSNSLNETQQITPSSDDVQIYENGITIDGSEYDDITSWVTLDALKKYAGCQDKSMDIAENRLPKIHYIYDETADEHYYDAYSFNLNPIGGVSDFSWCVESADSNVRSYLNFGANNFDNECTSDSDYITSDSINLNAPRGTVSGKLPSSSKVLVYLRDNSGNIITKDFILTVKESRAIGDKYEDDSEESTDPVTITPVSGGDVRNTALFMEDSEGGTEEDSNYLMSDSDSDGDSDTIKIVQNANMDAISAFYGCESEKYPDVPCPLFGNNGVFTAYFTAEFYNNTDNNKSPQGFTFAVIRSKYKSGNSEATSTESSVGKTKSGLGYGNRCYKFSESLQGGNSFAVEFDVYEDSSCKNDPDNDHIAIITYSSENNYDGTWNNGVQTGHTYSQYGSNIHRDTNGDPASSINYNRACTTPDTTGGACYFHTSEDVIPNTYKADGTPFGVRIEAISGCNSDGTECNEQSGADNHICVHMWKALETDMDNNATLKSDMTDVSTNHIYNNISKDRVIPLGDPLIKQCFVDDTTTNNTLDKIRFGFTSGAANEADSRYYFKFTDLKVNVGKY